MNIYLTTNNVNDKKYIGMTNGNNPDYLGSGLLIKQALKKYGRQNFSKKVIVECQSEEELREAEEFFISELNAVEDPSFYNLHEGGRGGDTGFHDDTDMSAIVKSSWDGYTEEERLNRINKNKSSGFGTYDKSGDNNPMAGRSAITEKNLKWYCNGEETIFVTEGTQPEGYWRGRK
jgi:hypothetical protein